MEVPDLFAVRIADDVAQAPVVHTLRPILRVPDDFVDEVAEVQHEAEPILLGGALILEDHPPIGVLRAVVGILAADEREAHRSRIVVGGAVIVRPTRLPSFGPVKRYQ